MRLAPPARGGKGTGPLVERGPAGGLVDCGFWVGGTEARRARGGRAPADLAAILVTHEHSDHGRGVVPLARKHGIPVVLTAGTARALDPAGLGEVRVIGAQGPFALGDFTVTPVAVPHDAREPVQFLFARG